jgi:hypothetical protein
MWPYWFLFLVPAWLAMTRLRPAGPVGSPARRWPDWWRVMFVLLVLMIGMRHEVGADWFGYLEHIENASGASLVDTIVMGDPAYSLLNWLAARSGLGPYFVNTVSAAIFTLGLVVFCRAQPRPWLALVVAVPYLVTVVAMGHTRQSVAIGLVMLGLTALSERKLLHFVVFVALATTFHKSALILMPLAVLAGTRNRLWTVLWVGLSSVLFFVFWLQESLAELQRTYTEVKYMSQGADVRVAMNVMPALLFLWFRRRFAMLPADRNFWTWMSFGAVCFVWLLQVSPSSTAVDRLALYWIPLQILVLSRLPNALGSPNGSNGTLVRWVVAYSAAVLFIWLVFGAYAQYWLPYQFYPWAALWN